MYLDFWSDEYEEVDREQLTTLVDEYKNQIDTTPFEALEARLDEYGIPVHETFPDEEAMIHFEILDEYDASVRVGSEGGLVNLYIRSELPMDVTKDEAIVRALYEIAQDKLGVSRIEASYYRNKEETSIQTLWRA